MRKTLIALALAATPVAAFEEMQLAECQNAWLAVVDTFRSLDIMNTQDVSDDFEEMGKVASEVTDDGWCRLVGGSVGLEDAEFGTFDWQAEGIDRFIKDGAPPLALQLRIADIYDGTGIAPPIDLDTTVRQVPGTGILLIEAFQLSDVEGAYLSLSAVLNGAFFDSRSSTLSSLGGITLQQLASRVTLTPERIADIDAPPMFQTARATVSDMLDGLDDQQLPDDSRTALMELMNALPDAHGILELQGVSERGLGWIQLGVAQSFNPDATNAEIIGFALSGVTIDATWTPVE